jgi:superfamily II DNA/RNA helicase
MQASAATYLHRIGRGGRFGKPAVAITLLDPARADDKPHMDDIIAHYKFDQSKIT